MMNTERIQKRLPSIGLSLALAFGLMACQSKIPTTSNNPVGEEAFMMRCAGCHGRDGGKEGSSAGRPLKGNHVPIPRIKEAVQNGIPPGMPRFPNLDPDTLEKLAEYVNGL